MENVKILLLFFFFFLISSFCRSLCSVSDVEDLNETFVVLSIFTVFLLYFIGVSGVSVCLTTMKAVALILALAVITGKNTAALVCVYYALLAMSNSIYPCFLYVHILGCNARAIRQAEATKNPWEETVDRFLQYITELGQNADGVVQNLRSSQLSRELE